ncbi:MAG: 3-isopropylmalate dehydrogenase [Neobacillus sp.]|nr:3-isopropylmalate dehydrogenase [Neobacillus sp.]
MKVNLTAAIKVGVEIEWIDLPIGWEGIKQHNDPLPEVTTKSLENTHGWILGPHDSAAYPLEHKLKLNPSGALRHSLDLFANIRPAKTMPGIKRVVGERIWLSSAKTQKDFMQIATCLPVIGSGKLRRI